MSLCVLLKNGKSITITHANMLEVTEDRFLILSRVREPVVEAVFSPGEWLWVTRGGQDEKDKQEKLPTQLPPRHCFRDRGTCCCVACEYEKKGSS